MASYVYLLHFYMDYLILLTTSQLTLKLQKQ